LASAASMSVLSNTNEHLQSCKNVRTIKYVVLIPYQNKHNNSIMRRGSLLMGLESIATHGFGMHEQILKRNKIINNNS